MQYKKLSKSYWMVAMLLFSNTISAQEDSSALQDTAAKYDRAYYESYPELITGRVYFSQKYTSLILEARESVDDLRYRPNTTLNFGVGATYGWFTLNLAYGFGFLNNRDNNKGKTRYLDLQSHIYTRKMSIDLFGQFYKGFYLYPKGTGIPQSHDWYVRPDVKVRHMGVAAYYIQNWKKFSMRAAMLQTEWQKHSAGSFLIGGEAYFGQSKADSAMVPQAIEAEYAQRDVTRFRYFDIGPGIGYAYTYVHQEHFFAMGGLTASFPLNFQKEWKGNVSETKFSISPDIFYRVGIGYSNERMNISVSWVNSNFKTKGESGEYGIRTGNVRLNAAYRFKPSERLKRWIKPFRSAI